MIGHASAPASAANLGPGFDCIALALDARCEVTVEAAAAWSVRSESVPLDVEPGHLIVRAATAAGAGPFRIDVRSPIPQARGLGSSAAVAAATYAAAVRAGGAEPVDRRVFDVVREIEGHGDNAAAAVWGGLVAVIGAAVRRLELAAELVPVAAVPNAPLSTPAARGALPSTMSRAEAARTLARAVFLVEGLRTGDADCLRAAAGDELHEAPRASLSPLTGELIAVARDAGALHASWSGAGPTALAFTTPQVTDRVVAALTAALGDGGEVVRFEVDGTGWK